MINGFREWLMSVAGVIAIVGATFSLVRGCDHSAVEDAESALKKNGAVTRCVTIGGDERCELICPSVAPIQEVRKP